MDLEKTEKGFSLISKRIFDLKELKLVFVSIVIFTIFLFFISPPWRVLNFDEVDYFNASNQGFWINAFDTTSLGIKSFLSLASWKLKLIDSPPTFLEYSEKFDTFLLRHFHPPLLQYITSYFTFIYKGNFNTAEKLVFLVRWGLGCVFILSSFFISSFLYNGKKKNFYYLVKILFISYSALLLSLYLQYHLLFSIFLIINLYFLINLLKTPSRSNYLFISIILTLSILSLETALFSILISSTIYSFIRIKRVDLIFSEFKRVIIYFWILPFTFSVILWPGALFKLSIFKSYGMYVYRLFFIKNEYAGVFNFERLSPILLLLLVYFFLFSLGLIILNNFISFKFQKISPYKLSFIFGSFYSISMLPFTLFHTYIVPGLFIATLPILEFLNSDILHKRLIKIINNILVLCIAIGFLQLSKLRNDEAIFGGFPGKESLSKIAEISKKNNIYIYSDAGHILEFYMPAFSERIRNISLIQKYKNKSKFKLFLREDQEYKQIKYDSINKPALFLFRESNLDVMNKLDYKCNALEIKGLDGYACIVD